MNTTFGGIEQPSKNMIAKIRKEAEKHLPQMCYCTRCRVDAVGLLGEERNDEFMGCLSACSSLPALPSENRPYVAVASREGILINQHLGEARSFYIWEKSGSNYRLVEQRGAPDRGAGVLRWQRLARILADCRVVLLSGAGQTPSDILIKSGIKPVEEAGFVEEGGRTVYEKRCTGILKGRSVPCAEKSCAGSGQGCG